MACAGARDTSVPSLVTKQPASTARPLGEGTAKGHLLAATCVSSLLWPSSLCLAPVLLANIGVWGWGGSQSEGGDNGPTNSGRTHPCCLRPQCAMFQRASSFAKPRDRRGQSHHLPKPGGSSWDGHMSSQEAMSPSHTFMVMDQDGLWSWELSY